MSNRKRLKKLILANKETRCLYRMMQFLAIFMIVSCLIIIATAKWIECDQNKKREEIFGSWDEVFLNVDREDLNYFRKNAFLEQISVQLIQEKVFLEGDQRVVIGSCDENFLEMGNIELLEGRMPEQKKEVAVEEEYLEILGVSKIGDVVSNESEVGSLFGYKVVGVIKNYSRNWKVINQDINYVNCFIYDLEVNEIKVYVQYGKWAEKDPEINMIEYRDNLHEVSINILNPLIKLFMISIVFMIFIEFIIYLILKKNNWKRFNRKIVKKIIDLLVILLYLTLIYTLWNTLNNIYHYDYTFNNSNILEALSMDSKLNGSTVYFLKNSHGMLYQTRIDANFLIHTIIYLIENLMCIIFLMFVICSTIISKILMCFDQNREYYYLLNYYKGVNRLKISLKNNEKKQVYIQNAITMIYCAIIFADYYHDLDKNFLLILLFSYLLIVLIINYAIHHIVCRYLSIQYKMGKL